VAADGAISIPHKVLVKINRPEQASPFLSPPPEGLVERLVESGRLTHEEAKLAPRIAMADDLCAVADAAGPTEKAALATLLPAIIQLRDGAVSRYRFTPGSRVGAAGGLGTPFALAAAFILGAEFVLTGSINQCTVEAATSDAVKDLLVHANVQDCELVPSEEMFELGARAQVLKRGVFFPSHANRLHDLYRRHGSIAEIQGQERSLIEQRCLRRSLEEAAAEARAHFGITHAAPVDAKSDLALIVRWYLARATRLALEGRGEKTEYQIYCGPAMGAFNQWVKGTRLEDRRRRHIDEIAWALMREAAAVLRSRLATLQGLPAEPIGASLRSDGSIS
jgi:trans-AT polyketide synthase/acyltransferase/oxidoreductase domain-containing protein